MTDEGMKVDLAGNLRAIASAMQHELALRAIGAELAVVVARRGLSGHIAVYRDDRVKIDRAVVRLWRERRQIGYDFGLAEVGQHRDMNGYARMVLERAADELLQR